MTLFEAGGSVLWFRAEELRFITVGLGMGAYRIPMETGLLTPSEKREDRKLAWRRILGLDCH